MKPAMTITKLMITLYCIILYDIIDLVKLIGMKKFVKTYKLVNS